MFLLRLNKKITFVPENTIELEIFTVNHARIYDDLEFFMFLKDMRIAFRLHISHFMEKAKSSQTSLLSKNRLKKLGEKI